MQKIISTLQSFGLDVSNIIADGNIHRCHSGTKGKKNKDGWYAIKEHKEKNYCYYGCWNRGEKGKCNSDGLNGIDSAVWGILKAKSMAATAKREQEGISAATKYIKNLKPAGKHKYLSSKKIQGSGALKKNKLLVLPLYNKEGEISSYQTINESGRKQFMTGGVVGGCCFPIPGDDSVVCICEGFATGASIHEATGYKVLCAMNAGNMIKIAKQAKGNVLICADNDWKKDKNVGLETGKKISNELGCGLVYPTDIKGTDFNDMAVESGLEAVKSEIVKRELIEIMNLEDAGRKSRTLEITPDMIAPGLIEQGMEAFYKDIPQYSLPLVLTVLGRSIGNRVKFGKSFANLYNIKVGGSTTGKSDTDALFQTYYPPEVVAEDEKNPKNNFVTVTDIASAAGLLRSLAQDPQGLGMFDEMTGQFRQTGKTDKNRAEKMDLLMELYSKNLVAKSYADKRNNLEVHNPCFSMIGNATSLIFDNISADDFSSGVIPRIGFWMFEEDLQYKDDFVSLAQEKKILKFIDGLRKNMGYMPPNGSIPEAMRGHYPLGRTDNAKLYIEEYGRTIIKERNLETDDGRQAILMRKIQMASKVSIHHHLSIAMGDYKKIVKDINSKDIQYGIVIADAQANWKLDVLYDQTNTGEFHKLCKQLKQAILVSYKSGRKHPTFAYLKDRARYLRNWDKKTGDSVIEILKKSGEIVVSEGRNGVTRYDLPKGK